MFRFSTVLRTTPSLLTARRWMAAAAKQSSRQKRALNEQQLGSASAASKKSGSGTSAASPTLSESAAPPLTANGGSNVLPLLGVGGLVAAGGAYYYFNVMEQQPTPTQDTVSAQVQPATTSEADTSTESSTVMAQVEEKQTSREPESGNRVVSIQVPGKMKNSAKEAAAAPAHPVDGHRVSMDSGGKTVMLIDDTSMTESAIKELTDSNTQEAAEALISSHQSLWGSMDEKFFQDLDSLNNAQLKARVVQLATEMKDHTKWEAVRLKEFLAMKEKDTANQYTEMLQKQRLDFEDLLARRLREQENELTQLKLHAVLEKEADVQKLLNTALEAQKHEYEEDKKAFEELTTTSMQLKAEEEYGRKLEEYKSRVEQDLEQKVSILEALSQKVEQLETALAASQSTQRGSLQAHRLSAAVLALSEKLETNQNAEKELKAMKDAAGTSDGVIATALATVPPAVASGVPTLSELQTSFETVLKKGRQAALVPEGRPGFDGQLIGMMFATLKYPPNPEDPAPADDVDNAEFVLVRAQQHVQLGELEDAVEQLEKLNGQAAFCVEDWKKDAMNRIAVEKALKAMMAELALLNKSLMEE